MAISGNQRQSSGSELLLELHLPIVVIVVVVVIIGSGSECRDQLAVRGVREESVRPQQRAQLVGGEAPKTARVGAVLGATSPDADGYLSAASTYDGLIAYDCV